MPDFRIADTAPEHRKLRAAGLAAVGLWGMAGSYAMRELTDGWVPVHFVTTWPGGKRLAAKLVEVGLWTPEKRHGIDGWAFHDWLDIQRSAEQIQAERDAANIRRALYADPDLLAAVRARDSDHCRYCGRKVSWTNRRGSAGATFDHVIPIPAGGRNTLDNVVVACRGCNSGKRSRTPADAGMRLLPPPKSTSDRSQFGTSSELSPKPSFEPDPEQEHSQHPPPPPTSGYFGGEGPEPARGRDEPPPSRCPKHLDAPTDAPCGPCGDARRARQRWDTDHAQAEAAQRSTERSTEARRAAELRAIAAMQCDLCDDNGYHGGHVCDHDPHAHERAARGRAAVQAALTKRTQETA